MGEDRQGADAARGRRHRGAGRRLTTFAVTVERFGEWDWSRDLRDQAGWDEHAAFMDALAEDGFIVLGGPLADGVHVLHVVEARDEAEVRARLADDPWHGRLLRVVSVQAWEILLRAP